MNNILKLTYQRVKRSRKNSLFIFLVLLLSFSCAIVSVSVIGSIGKTNAEYLLDTYGEWYFAVPYGYKSDGEWLSEREWNIGAGISENVGTMEAHNKSAGIGTVNQTLIDIGRIKLNQGVFPSSDNEIAMEADLLSALGYDYTLGQEISVTVTIPLAESDNLVESEPLVESNLFVESNPLVESDPLAEEEPLFSLTVEKTYTLCGVIHEYTDLWYLSNNKSAIPLSSAIISPNAAAELISDAEKKLSDAEKTLSENTGITVRQPIPQYFVSVSEENRVTAKDEFNNYLGKRLSDGKEGDIRVCVNSVAYSSGSAENSRFYMYMIVLLTFISVICLEIIRLPSTTHSFSVLRSIGMSKKQLALMQLSEILIIGIPAILLGIPLGAGLTWIALRLTLFSGIVPIQVYLPYDMMFFIIALWIAAIILSRLIIFAFTLRVPMTGKLQMSTPKTKRAKVLRSGFIILLLCIFSECVVFTGIHSLAVVLYKEQISYSPSYYLYRIQNESYFYEDDINAVKEIPGISQVLGYSELYIGLSFDGQSEDAVHSAANVTRSLPYGMVHLLVINENDWTDTLDFGNDKEAFHNGEFVFVSVPGGVSIPGTVEKEYPLPDGEANINIYSYSNKFMSNLENNSRDNDNRSLIGSRAVKTRNIVIPVRANHRGVASISYPYTVICSERFFSDLLKSLPEDHVWGSFITGGEAGYAYINVMTDLSAENLSTDIIIAKMCKERGISLSNLREEHHARIQESVQNMIMLFFSGTCIGIITLMILLSNISLETENEKRDFLIKRCIGMSKRQVSINIIGKTVIRCMSAFALSCIMYFLWQAFVNIANFAQIKRKLSFPDAITAIARDLMYYCQQYGIGAYAVMLLLGLVLPVILILFFKKDLRKDGDIK